MIISNLIAAINTAIVEGEGVGTRTFTIINIVLTIRRLGCSREREVDEECSPYNNMAGFVLIKFSMQLSEFMTKIPNLFSQQKLVGILFRFSHQNDFKICLSYSLGFFTV